MPPLLNYLDGNVTVFFLFGFILQFLFVYVGGRVHIPQGQVRGQLAGGKPPLLPCGFQGTPGCQA